MSMDQRRGGERTRNSRERHKDEDERHRNGKGWGWYTFALCLFGLFKDFLTDVSCSVFRFLTPSFLMVSLFRLWILPWHEKWTWSRSSRDHHLSPPLISSSFCSSPLMTEYSSYTSRDVDWFFVHHLLPCFTFSLPWLIRRRDRQGISVHLSLLLIPREFVWGSEARSSEPQMK